MENEKARPVVAVRIDKEIRDFIKSEAEKRNTTKSNIINAMISYSYRILKQKQNECNKNR